jgi:hypothetical protein
MIPGSFFNEMLDCGHWYNQWVEIALCYLPQTVLEENKDKLAFISTAQVDGCRVARHYCENCEVIFLSERILPKQGADEGQPDVRYFIYVVLHEVVHAIKKHKSPKFNKLTPEEKKAQEDEADVIAMEWFNEYIKALNNKYLKPITQEEIQRAKRNNQDLMEKLYTGV